MPTVASLLDELANAKAEMLALRQKVTEQAVEIHSLRARLDVMCRKMYGRSAEQVSREQLEFAFAALMKEGLVDDPEGALEADSGELVNEKPRRKRTKRKGKISPAIPREEVLHEPEHTTCSCCDGAMKQIGEERSEEIVIVPAIVKVLEHVRPKYACPTCKDGVEIAPPPEKLFDRGRYGCLTRRAAKLACSWNSMRMTVREKYWCIWRASVAIQDSTTEPGS